VQARSWAVLRSGPPEVRRTTPVNQANPYNESWSPTRSSHFSYQKCSRMQDFDVVFSKHLRSWYPWTHTTWGVTSLPPTPSPAWPFSKRLRCWDDDPNAGPSWPKKASYKPYIQYPLNFFESRRMSEGNNRSESTRRSRHPQWRRQGGGSGAMAPHLSFTDMKQNAFYG